MGSVALNRERALIGQKTYTRHLVHFSLYLIIRLIISRSDFVCVYIFKIVILKVILSAG